MADPVTQPATYVIPQDQATGRLQGYDDEHDNVNFTPSSVDGQNAAENVAAVSRWVDFFRQDAANPDAFALSRGAEDTFLAQKNFGLFFDFTGTSGAPVDATTVGGRVAATLKQDITFDSNGDGIMETYRGEAYARVKVKATTDTNGDGKINDDDKTYQILGLDSTDTDFQAMTLAELAAAEKKDISTYAELDGVVRYRFTEVRSPEVARDRSLSYDYEGDAIERTEAAMDAAAMDEKWAYLPLGALKLETQVTIPATTGRGGKAEHSDYRPDNPNTTDANAPANADERAYVNISDVTDSQHGFEAPTAEGAKPYEVRLPLPITIPSNNSVDQMRTAAIEHLKHSMVNKNPYEILPLPQNSGESGEDYKQRLGEHLVQYIPGGRSVEEWYADSIAYHTAIRVGELSDAEARDYVARLEGNPSMVVQIAVQDSTNYRDHLSGKKPGGEAPQPDPRTGGEAPRPEGAVPEDPYKDYRNIDVQGRLLRGLGLLGEEDKTGEGRRGAEQKYAELIGPGGALKDKSPEEILALARVLERGGTEAHAAKTWLLGPKDLAHSLPSFVRESQRKDTDPKDPDNPDAVSGSMAGRDDGPADAERLDNFSRETFQPRINDANKKLAQAEDWLERQGKGEIVPPPDAAKVEEVRQERARLRGELDGIYFEAQAEAKKMANATRYMVDENEDPIDDAYLQQWGLSGFSAEEEEKARLARRADGVGKDGKRYKRFKEARETIGDTFKQVLAPGIEFFEKIGTVGIQAYSAIASANTARDGTAVQLGGLEDQKQARIENARNNRQRPNQEQFAQTVGALRPQGPNPAEAAAASMQGIVDEVTGTTSDTGPNAGKTPEQVKQEREAATQQYLAQLNQREQEERQKERRESGGTGSGGSFGLA